MDTAHLERAIADRAYRLARAKAWYRTSLNSLISLIFACATGPSTAPWSRSALYFAPILARRGYFALSCGAREMETLTLTWLTLSSSRK